MLLKANVESIECIVCQDHLLLFGVLSWSGQEEDGGRPAEVLHGVGPFEFLTFQTGLLLLKMKKT